MPINETLALTIVILKEFGHIAIYWAAAYCLANIGRYYAKRIRRHHS